MFIFPNKTVHRPPWNKGKLTGQKPPLLPKHVWAIRTKLHLDGRIRDLALFNLAIDSKLRGCDLVNLKAGDVAPHGYAIDRAMVRQRKTGRPVKFEIAEHTRQAVDNYNRTNPRTPDFFCLWGGGNKLTVNNPSVRPVGVPMGNKRQLGRITIWHAFTTVNQGYPHLSANREPSSGSTASWTF